MCQDDTKKRLLYSVALLVYLVGIVGFTFWSNYAEHARTIDRLDQRLALAAQSLKYMLADDFHDRAVDENSISYEEEMKNRRAISRFAGETEFVYLYCVVERNGKLFFSAPTVTDEEARERTSWYFYPYDDPPREFIEALHNNATVYVNYADQWGSFRSVAIAETSPGGKRYLACADIRTSDVNQQLSWNVFHSILVALFFLVLIIPFFYVSKRVTRIHTKTLQRMNQSLSARAEELLETGENLEAEIEERIKAEEHFRESERRLNTILESVQAGIMIVDPETKTIVEVNRQALVMMKRTREEVLGRVCHQFVCPAEDGKCPIYDLGKPIDCSERELITSNGRHLPILKTVSYLELDGKEHLLESFTDISQLKQSELERVRLETRLRQSQKMEAVGTLAGGIAHDFNNILGAIMGFAQIARVNLKEDEETSRYIDEILSAGRRATELIRHILTFSRQREQEKNPVNIIPVVKETLKLLRAGLPANIEVEQRIETDPAVVMGDPTQIQQVIMNLCTNAAQAIGSGSGFIRVTLEKEHISAGSQADLLGVAMGHYIVLRVEDSGHGIEPIIQDRVYDPYFSTKPPGEGTGLGLALVHGIVKGHGGVIRLDSSPGKGTTFTVHLPLLKQTEPHKGINKNGLQTGTESILFIDDERPLVETGRRMLEHLGYRVTTRTSSVEGLEAFRASPDAFDLIITDYSMPNMNGLELTKAIHEIRPGRPVLLCTGFSAHIPQEKLRDLGIKAVLMKPMLLENISPKIREALD